MFSGMSTGGGPQGAAAPTATATSVTSLATAGSGDKAFTTQAGKPFLVGTRLRATSAATGQWMEGVVKTYVTTTLTITMNAHSGTNTHADWNITITGEPGADLQVTGDGFVHVTAGVVDPAAADLRLSDITDAGTAAANDTSDFEPAGAVAAAASDYEPAGAVAAAASDYEPAGAVAAAASDYEPAGAVATAIAPAAKWVKVVLNLAALQAGGASNTATYDLGAALAAKCIISGCMLRIVTPLVGVLAVSCAATVGITGDNSLLTAGLDPVAGSADAYRTANLAVAKFSGTLQPTLKLVVTTCNLEDISAGELEVYLLTASI